MSTNNGIQLEKDIVNRNFNNHDVTKIYNMMNSQGIDTSSPMRRIGKYVPKWDSKKTEPKTDIITGCGKRISVKLHGPVQLASIGLDATQFHFATACRNLGLSIPQITAYNNQINKMLTRKNMPYRLRGEQEYSNWYNNVRPTAQDSLEQMLSNYPGLKQELVCLTLTGVNLFDNPDAQADYILTPQKLKMLNPSYIKKVVNLVKIRFSQKGRGKVKGTDDRLREGSMRFDLNMKKIP